MNKIIQDMVPKNKPPLRQAIPLERENPKEQKPSPARVRRETVEPQPSNAYSRGTVGKRTVKPWLFGLIAVICVLAIIYAVSLVYAKASVVITPASVDIPVSGAYTAYENAAASGTLAYQIIQANAQTDETVAASIGPAVTTSAQGNIVLYNNYGAASQKIVAGTRLSSGNGLIYKTDSAVTVPGIANGVAGSVVVAVTAAAGGSSYNIPISALTTNPSYGDFSVVAYKGTAKYSGFYGRLNPDGAGITGGSSGNQIIVASSTVASANQAMEQSLQKNLLAQAQALIPAGYIMFNNAYNINYAPTAASTTSSTTAVIGVQGSFYGIIFNTDALAEAIAPTQYNSSFNPEDLQSAIFTITNPQAFSFTNGTALNFSLKGTMNLVGIISTTTLASQLAGISLAQSNAIFKGYGAIATAHATIFPFWKHSFPSSPSRISVIVSK